MPQIALNLDAAVFTQIEKAAAQRHTSIYSWIEQSIKDTLRHDYSADSAPGFFSMFGAINDDTFKGDTDKYPNNVLALFGAVKDDTFVEPPEIDARYDLPREEW
jgi:hypothetical protein